jgi:adenosylcobinamide-phosphate synthase
MIMRLEYQILIAVLLDLMFGDPRWFPHPVRLIGRLITALEGPARRAIPDARTAGSVTALTVIVIAVVATAVLIGIAGEIHPLLGDAVGIVVLYTTIAARDLARHSLDVYRALARFDLADARRLVSWMVGRDTERLTEAEVVRAAVESVAENSVDGIIAPLFFAAVAGPIGAMAYKAVNTLDSMIGYRNERYLDFGRTAARIDDWANFIPARLAAPIMTAAAAILGLRASAAWRIARRDGRKNLSPNAGIPEAAVAGALGVRLGGAMERRGRPVNQPEIGDPLEPLGREHILAANRLMFLATAIAAAMVLAVRWGVATILTDA